MVIIKSERFILRPFRKGDEKSLVEGINNKKIFRNTLSIPYPYTLKDAQKWLEKTSKDKKKKKPTALDLVIDINGEIIGGIGFYKIEEHRAEIGYWLAEKHWGKGIMTQAVKVMTKFGFEKLKLRRIYACVFSFNKDSMRVLEQNGYKLEGILRKEIRKGKKLLDDYLYAKVK